MADIVYVVVRRKDNSEIAGMSRVDVKGKRELSHKIGEWEVERLRKEFPEPEYNIDDYYGAKFEDNSPVEEYAKKHPQCHISAEEILRREKMIG